MGNRKKTQRPVCPFKRFDCFAYMTGDRCFCLDKTDFRTGHECPFYKREEDVDHLIVMEKYKEENGYV